jgi:hypothetical protein
MSEWGGRAAGAGAGATGDQPAAQPAAAPAAPKRSSLLESWRGFAGLITRGLRELLFMASERAPPAARDGLFAEYASDVEAPAKIELNFLFSHAAIKLARSSRALHLQTVSGAAAAIGEQLPDSVRARAVLQPGAYPWAPATCQTAVRGGRGANWLWASLVHWASRLGHLISWARLWSRAARWRLLQRLRLLLRQVVSGHFRGQNACQNS